jgi:hypothetical protein
MDFLQAVNRFRQGETSNPDTNAANSAKISYKINVQFVTYSPAPHAGDLVGSIRLLGRLPLPASLPALSDRATNADITNKDPVRTRNQPRDIHLSPATKGAVKLRGGSGFPVRDGLLRYPDSRRIGVGQRIENLLTGSDARGTDGNSPRSGIEGICVRDSLRTK